MLMSAICDQDGARQDGAGKVKKREGISISTSISISISTSTNQGASFLPQIPRILLQLEQLRPVSFSNSASPFSDALGCKSPQPSRSPTNSVKEIHEFIAKDVGNQEKAESVREPGRQSRQHRLQTDQIVIMTC